MSKVVFWLSCAIAATIGGIIGVKIASKEGLESLKNGSIVRIEPYTKNGYDKVRVWGEGVKLDWVTKQLPPIEEATIGGRRVKDDTKRMAYITSLYEKIREEIREI